ncbi:MAG: zinc ABC transporter substrate-binding protein [Simkaniaceae bacterium]|nr:zinc ABC transporter substrate-binding protein [Simkaniaceae bacterium]
MRNNYLRVFVFITVISLSVFFMGCSKNKRQDSSLDQWMKESQKVKVLSTTAIVNDLVANVGKEHINPIVLIPGSADPHSYELVKGDDEKLSRADVIFYNGLGLEHGASIYYALSHAPHAVSLGDALLDRYFDQLIYVDQIVDPHIWMNINLWMQTVDFIVDKLSEIDLDHAADYKANGEKLKEDLMLLDRQIFLQMQSIPSKKRYLVTSHDAFNYFACRYMATPEEMQNGTWGDRFQAPEGLAPDGQLGVHDIEKVLDHIAKYEIEFLFPESNVSLDSLKKIHAVAKSKGLTIHFSKTPLFGDSMSGGGEEAGSYVEMMRHNAKVIESFLNQSEGLNGALVDINR